MSDGLDVNSALISDPDPVFLKRIQTDLATKACNAVIAETEAQFEIHLNKNPGSFSGIFLNPKNFRAQGIEALKLARTLYPTTALFLLRDSGGSTSLDAYFKGLSIFDSLKKPLTHKDILRAMMSSRLALDSEVVLGEKPAGIPGEAGSPDAKLKEADFVPITTTRFIAGSISYFDVYVRIADRFVKVLRVGDAFSSERLQHYQGEVSSFYLRKDAQNEYMHYCDEIARSLLGNAKVSLEAKVAVTSTQGEETLLFLKKYGLNDQTIQYAEKFVDNVRNLVTNMNLSQHSTIKGFLNHIELQDHVVATTMISAILALSIKFSADRIVSTVGLAGFFHDIGLSGMDPKFIEEDESKFTPEELVVYQTHPVLGAAMLSETKRFDPIVVQAIEQHHERRSRKGFPKRMGTGSINKIAEIIGLSEEFARQIQKAKQNPNLDPVLEVESFAFGGFSTATTIAFRSAFGQK